MAIDIYAVNPYIRVAMPSVLPQGTVIKRRVIFDYELLYVERGEFVLWYNESEYRCTEGRFVLLRPGTPHSFSGIETDLSQPHIHFDVTYSPGSPKVRVSFKDIDAFTAEERERIRPDVFEEYPNLPFVQFSDTARALELFYGIIARPSPAPLIQKARMIELIEMLVTDNFPDCLSAATDSNSIARQVKDYIDAGQGMSVDLAGFEKQFCYSKYYLEREFKKRYGMGLVAYRNEKRMELARELLRTETVTAVADRLGFSSIYVFSRAFRQRFGVSPSEVKKEE